MPAITLDTHREASDRFARALMIWVPVSVLFIWPALIGAVLLIARAF